MIEDLRDILSDVKRLAGRNFTGIGLLVSDTPQTLPICSLRPVDFLVADTGLVALLARISTKDSEFHDGFHVLTGSFDVAKIAQYFSPPIVKGLKIDRSKIFGGRYLAALFGSTLPGVRATGIASIGFGIAIFQNGQEVFHSEFS
ncbi:hypothetical protein [Paraburkholderia tropica]|uniref:hypothetical protein n=1 Tax=Paraburkholderia tropica TaxID=92647 RepID=UPI002AB04219|nr:hypothetical protein [Paraburkholderia tropica]